MKLKIILVILAIFSLRVNTTFSPFRTIFEKLHQEPPSPVSVFRNNIELKYIAQKLDNFDEKEKRTWQMRYMSNDYYFQRNGPIFIFVGGEWKISDGYLRGGHMFDMAKSLNGYMFYTEHRFYGRSQPTVDLSTENLKYLNVKQALADLAHFIKTMKSSIRGLENSKVILVGASYSATMVTWFRRIYPELINGAWASSAPLHTKVDFIEYKEVVGESIKLVGGQECYDRIASSIKTLEDDVKSDKLGKVQQYLNICSSFDTSNKKDVQSLFSSISEIFAGLVQSHTTGDIEKACMQIMSAKNDVSGLGDYVKRYIGGNNKCMDLNYEAEVKEMKLIAHSDLMMRQWYYQTCNEFAWYQTSGSENQPFGISFPAQHYIDICTDIYGNLFNADVIAAKVKETNDYFGGFEPNVTNVYFSQGQLDPWHVMGIRRNDDNGAVLPLYAHCKDLGSSSPSDTVQMAKLKKDVTQRVKEWLA